MLREENGKTMIENCVVQDLVDQYQTPLYVLSETTIKNKCSEIRDSFLNKYENTRAAYAAKAFLTMGMCKIIEREGLCLDVVSGGELFVAMKASFPPEKIEFNGNNKSNEELEMALSYGIGRIIVDNLYELDRLIELTQKMNKKASILFRITPGIRANTHSYITTGQVDSKFGIPLIEEQLKDAVKKAIYAPGLNFLGYHFHIGSQLHQNDAYLNALDVMLDMVKRTKEEWHHTVKEINIGGGFGIYYNEQDQPKSISFFVDPIMEKITNYCTDHNLQIPAVVMEPGRFIVGEAGLTIYRVGSIKEIPGIRTYVSVDGGMTDNIRPALYGARYEAELVNKQNEKKDQCVTICGKCCESGDILIKDICLPKIASGDLLAIKSTGAYNYCMASRYNKLTVPPVVLINGNDHQLMVKRETYEDLIKNDCELVGEY